MNEVFSHPNLLLDKFSTYLIFQTSNKVKTGRKESQRCYLAIQKAHGKENGLLQKKDKCRGNDLNPVALHVRALGGIGTNYVA
jgi:hypothetical protein